MNTLNKEITKTFFTQEGDYERLEKHWSELVNSPQVHNLQHAHYLLYLAIRGKNWKKGFTPFRNHKKIVHQGVWNWGGTKALLMIYSKYQEDRLLAPFGGIITKEGLAELRSYLPVYYKGQDEEAFLNEKRAA